MTQLDVARSLTSVAYLSRIEAGERQPSPELLEQLAGRLGVEVSDLTRGGSRSAEGLRFELAHADLLLASGHLDDAMRVGADLADIARCLGLVDVEHAASIVRASALSAAGRHVAAVRILRPLSTGPMSMPAMVALARTHLARSRYERVVAIGHRVIGQIAARNPISLPEAADLAVSVCEAYAAMGRPSASTHVAGLALTHLRAPTSEEESAFPPDRSSLTGVPFRSLEQIRRRIEIAVASSQANKLRDDLAKLEDFALTFDGVVVRPAPAEARVAVE